MSEGHKAGEWRSVPAGKRGQVLSSGDVVDGGIEEAVVEGCAVDKASKDMIEECRVTNRLIDTDKQSNSDSGRENNVYDIDVCKAAGQYGKQDECNNDKTNINREYSGSNRRGDMGDRREVREYQGHIFFDSVARRATHELVNDRETESDDEQNLRRRAAGLSEERKTERETHMRSGLSGTSLTHTLSQRHRDTH